MRNDIVIVSHGVHLSAWHHEAESDALTTSRGRPCVVMAHGLGGTKDAGLEPYAERFAAAGADVVVFDYRGFGTSDGEPRHVVDHRRHREDYQAVVAHARALPGVDPDHIVLWGTSYSGGHVIAVAAKDPLIAGVKWALAQIYRDETWRRLWPGVRGTRSLGRSSQPWPTRR